jgi:hypothetical protein
MTVLLNHEQRILRTGVTQAISVKKTVIFPFNKIVIPTGAKRSGGTCGFVLAATKEIRPKATARSRSCGPLCLNRIS